MDKARPPGGNAEPDSRWDPVTYNTARMYNGAWNKQVVFTQKSALPLNGQGTTQQRTLQSRTSGSSPPSVCTLLEVLQWPRIYARSSCQVDPLLSLYSKGKGVRECESTRMREDDSARERCEEPEG